MLSETVVERYARAIYEVAAESGEVAALGGHLEALSQLYWESGPLREALHNPAIPQANKVNLLQALAGSGAPAVLIAFLNLVVANNRSELLGSVGVSYARLHDQARGIRRATVTTALPLSDEQAERLAESLARVFNSPIEVEAIVEPETIGGLCVQVDDLLIDGSIRGRLKRLQDQFAQARDTIR